MLVSGEAPELSVFHGASVHLAGSNGSTQPGEDAWIGLAGQSLNTNPKRQL